MFHIRYALFKSNLKNGAVVYVAKVRALRTVYMNTVVTRMKQSGVSPSPEQLIAWIEEFYSAIETLVQEGYVVVTPLAIFGARIKGPFANRYAPFEPNIHQVLHSLKATRRYRQLFKQPITTEQIAPTKVAPDPVNLLDKTSGQIDGMLTPGKSAYLRGEKLQFDENDETQGIFLIDANGNETRVTTIIRNMPKQIIFEIPTGLAGGEYQLVVRAKIRGGQELREGRLEATLIID